VTAHLGSQHPHSKIVVLIALALIATAVVRARAAAEQDASYPEAVLARAGEYVDALEASYARIVGAEDYLQTVRSAGGRTESRHLESEVFFVRLDESSAWMMVRSILKVDGRSVPGSHDRIMAALADAPARRTARLRALADEGARFNIGGVQRNFSDPLLAATFVDRARRRRFAFKAAADVAAGVHRLRFDEQVRPTLIRNARTGESIPASGTLDVADDGRITRTELQVEVDERTTAGIRVSFEVDAKLGVAVPAMMEEDYAAGAPGETVITCKAVYSNFRRFETAVRIVP
jgi:hypothetical protein